MFYILKKALFCLQVHISV